MSINILYIVLIFLTKGLDGAKSKRKKKILR